MGSIVRSWHSHSHGATGPDQALAGGNGSVKKVGGTQVAGIWEHENLGAENEIFMGFMEVATLVIDFFGDNNFCGHLHSRSLGNTVISTVWLILVTPALLLSSFFFFFFFLSFLVHTHSILRFPG